MTSFKAKIPNVSEITRDNQTHEINFHFMKEDK